MVKPSGCFLPSGKSSATLRNHARTHCHSKSLATLVKLADGMICALEMDSLQVIVHIALHWAAFQF